MDVAVAKPGQPEVSSLWTWMEQAPLFHAAWLFALGVFLCRLTWIPPVSLLLGMAGLAILAGGAAWRCVGLAWLPAGCLLCLLGAWCAEMEPQPAPAAELLHLSDHLARTMEGTIARAGPWRDPSQSPDAGGGESGAQRLDVQLSSIEFVDDREDVQKPIRGAVRLVVRWPKGDPTANVPPFRCGERIRVLGRLAPPQTYHDPGVWDRAAYLLDQGITATAAVDFENVERLSVARRSSPGCRIAEFQQFSAERLLALPGVMRHLPAWMGITQKDAVMLTAMVTGDRTFLTHSLRAGFERTGSFHMLVVSGLHLAIVSGWVMWIARRLRWSRIPATLLTIAGSLFYALFTGFATPVQRSLWMVILYLLGMLVFRQRSALNSIGLAALCLLAVSPRSLLESSFQMTLLAVIAIAGVATPLLDATLQPYARALRQLRATVIDAKLAPHIAEFRVILRMIADRLELLAGPTVAWKVFPWIVRVAFRSGELVFVTVVIEAAMTLPMALYFHRITLFALPVNMLILPLLVVLMPIALLTWIALLLWPPMAAVPGTLTALLLHFGLGLVQIFGGITGSDLRIPGPVGWQILTFCVLLAAAILLARGSGMWIRRAALAALGGLALVAVVPRHVHHPKDALLMEAIDVGQGDSALLVTPDGKALLVDGGGVGGPPRVKEPEFDIGEEVVSTVLWARGIRHLDAVALSHAHSDHMGGLPAILRNFHPQELWVGNNPPSAGYRALLAEAKEMGVAVRTMRAGEQFRFGKTEVRVLAPLSDYQPGAEPANNDSLVLQVAYRATSALLEGDAEEPIERGMLAEPNLASMVLKVGHHGSVTSTRPEFLMRVAPHWAVISCGFQNRFGQPHPDVLQALQAAQVRTFSTDIHGATCFELNGTSVTPVPWCAK